MADTQLDRAARLLRAHLSAMQATIADSIAELADLTTGSALDDATRPLFEKVTGQASSVKTALDAYADILKPAIEGHGTGEGTAWIKPS